MLTRWITVAAFLAASTELVSAAIGQQGLTVAPTCRVKGHSEAELILSCGDEMISGVVQFWHTPFGDLETSGFLSTLDSVFVHHDGSLVVPNATRLHSGLYYCLLKHEEGSTLWPYELSVGQTDAEHSDDEGQSCGAFRFRTRTRRDVGSREEKQGGVSDEQFAGAVVASVLLTFVVGFSAGALSRTQVLRCLSAITMKLRSPQQRQRRRQADTPDHSPKVPTPTRTNVYNNEALEMEEVTQEEDSAMNVTMESTVSSTTSFPPAKPKRSFREEEPETTAYLEGCDYMRVEEKEVEEERTNLEEENEECDQEVEEREVSCSFYISEKDEGSHDGTEEDEHSEDQEKNGGESGEENEEANEAEISSSSSEDEEDEEDSTGSEEEDKETKEEEGEGLGKEANEENKRKVELEMDEKQEDTVKNVSQEGEEIPAPSPTPRGRRSRVIRLYQYDEDGQRYGHLPNPTPDEPGPAPRLKQRSLSLTRLSAIMAASAGPLDTKETGKEEEKPHFHMVI